MLDAFRKSGRLYADNAYTYNGWVIPEPAFKNTVNLLHNLWILTDMFYTWKEYWKIFCTWYCFQSCTGFFFFVFGAFFVINTYHKYTISLHVCACNFTVIKKKLLLSNLKAEHRSYFLSSSSIKK